MEKLEHKAFLAGVRCMTFNQSQYITDALDGFVLQQTGFPYVCMIVDDASTEGEPDVIRRYLNENFDWEEADEAFDKEEDFGQILFARHKANQNCYFAVILLKENHYSQRKNKLAYFEGWLDAKYIALCEGDDYWTDPLKLQKQVDYLETHPGCLLTVHAADWKTGEDIYPYGCMDAESKDYSVDDLIQVGGFYFATASFVFRSELDDDWPEWRQNARVGDYPLQILAGLRGTVHFMSDKMCVYRYQRAGSWSYRWQKENATNIAYQKNKIEWMTLLDESTAHKYQGVIYDQLFPNFNSLFNLGEVGFRTYARAAGRMRNKRYGRVLKDGIHYLFTRFHRKPWDVTKRS